MILIMFFIDRFVVHHLYVSDRAEISSAVGIFGMLVPSIAHLLTRLITKEGFSNVYLVPNVKKHFGTYFASVFVILGLSFTDTFVVWRTQFPQYSLGEFFHNVKGIPIIMFQIAMSIIMFFPAFGEEWGWRGYMMPKLTELFGTPAAVIIGGIIWGVWHAPFTVNGHNFGVDYPGFPYMGILYMCVFCTAMNAFLTLLTEKSKSIYPASFAHMINNNVLCLVVISAFGSEELLKHLEKIKNTEVAFGWGIVPTLIVGVVSFVLLCKMKKQEVL